MDKIAQRRSRLNKIREKLNAPEEAIMGAFSPEFTRLMDTLREVDDEIREHSVDLKDMLKVARSNYNRREYMATIAYLGKFHERLDVIRSQFTKLVDETNSVHNEFLFGDLDDEHKSYLFQHMPEKYKPKAKAAPESKKASSEDDLTKKAGIKDWWHNITDDRGKSLRNWEKKFPKAAKEIKRQTERMLNRSEIFTNYLLSTLKTLATLRATRQLEEYIKVGNSFVQKYNAYDNAFNDYFNGSVRSYIENQKKFEEERIAKQKIIEEQKNRPLPGDESAEPDVTTNKLPTPPTPPDAGPGGGASPLPNTLIDPRIQEKIEVDQALKNEIDNTPGSWPKIKDDKDTTRHAPTVEDVVFEPRSSDVESFYSSRPESGIKNVVRTHPSANPETPTLRSPTPVKSVVRTPLPQPTQLPTTVPSVAPAPKSHNIYEQPIPRPPKVPSLSELNKPPTPSQLSRFIYYTPPEDSQVGIPTVKPPTTMKKEFEKPVSTKPYPLPSTATEEFIEKITKMSDQNPLVLAKEIIVYAKTIQDTDKSTSDRLLTIARNLLK